MGWNMRVNLPESMAGFSLWRLNNEHQACTCSQDWGWAGGNRVTQLRNEKTLPVSVFCMKLLEFTPKR